MILNEYSKAIVGGLVAFLGTLQVANLSGGITLNEWIWIATSTLAGAGLVAVIPNSGTYAWIDTQEKNAEIAKLVRTAKTKSVKE